MKIVSAYAGRSILATVALVSLFSVHAAVAQDAVEFIKIDVGGTVICGLRSDGTAACTSQNFSVIHLPPELTAIKDLATRHSRPVYSDSRGRFGLLRSGGFSIWFG